VPRSYFRAILTNADPDDPGRVGAGVILLIFILAVVIRLFACRHTCIINPDGVYYIHQAKAIYYGEWHSLTSCHVSFVSSYPFFVAGAYVLFHEWVAAAQFVSLFFGSMTLIPLYHLCRRFFDRDVSALTLLVFALLPVFVVGSAEVVRGPVCWFFLSLGLLFFVKSSENRDGLALLLSSLSLMIAAWARIEAAVFILVSLVYLLAIPQEGRIRKAACFALPLMAALSVVFCAVIFLDAPLNHLLRLNDVIDKLSAPFTAYETLRAGLEELRLAELMKQPPDNAMPHFLHKTRHLVWLVALGTLVKYMVRAYFYVFFILFILGMGGVWRCLRQDRRALYLALMAASIFIVFYLHVIQTWMMFDRFWAIFMLPAFMVIGFGLEKTLLVMKTRCRLKPSTALPLLCVVILACSLPKDFKSREADKTVYRKIGEMISHQEGNAGEIRIVKSLRTPDWTPFYANLKYEGAICPQTHFGIRETHFDETVFRDYETLISYLKNNHATYFLWEERAWPQNGFDLLDRKSHPDLKEVGTWHHPDVGKVTLFRVIS